MNVLSGTRERARSGVRSVAPGQLDYQRGGHRLRSLKERWRQTERFSYPPRQEWPVELRRARLAGFAVLGVQLVVLGWWSTVLVNRFALSKDFAAYQQAAYLIAHGHLNPFSTVLVERFWRNDTELIIWPLAVFVRLWPHLTALPWLQDLALVGAEAVALNWMCEIAAARARREGEIRLSVAIVALGVVLLIGNPWTAWTASFDVHLEPFVTLFTLCAARDLYTGRWRTWIWVLLALACGSVGASYMLGLGVSAMLVGRRWLRQGAGLAGLGALWIGLLQTIHGAQAAGVLEYNYLYTGHWGGKLAKYLSGGNIAVQALEHPWRIVGALWRNKVNLWANLSPGGLIGVVWLPLTFPVLLVAAEGGLSTPLFSRPGFQSIAVGPLVALGTVALLAAIPVGSDRRRRLRLLAAMMVLCVNAAAWAIVWLPQVSGNWLLVQPGASNLLHRLSHQMGPKDEVLASQGVMGGFADRSEIYELGPHSTTVPIHSRTVWIVITPSQGIETNEIHGFYAEVQALDADPRMHLMAASHGVWAYRFTPPPHQRQLKISFGAAAREPAWALTGVAGTRVTAGPRNDWYATSTGRSGYVVNQSYWREPAGHYDVSAALSVTGWANIELWDADTDVLLGRHRVRETHGVQTESFQANLASAPPAREPSGWGIWKTTPVEPNGNSLEIRVWTPGGASRVSVYSVALRRVAG